MRYSPKEMVIIETIAAYQQNGHSEIDLDDIIDVARPQLDPGERQAYFRSGVLSCIRNLRLKLPDENLGIVPNGVVGRGNKATFKISGDYKKFLNDKALERI